MTSGPALGSPMNRIANIFVLVLGRIEDRAARFGERKLYRICRQTIFISGKPQWYDKPLTQLRFMSRSGGHSPIYWCQQRRIGEDASEDQPSRVPTY